ncbi:MAG: aminotransferase class I/II-fold pyridoxal phosphate-dependent enzyme [Sandaracinaceae bacterium]|nr:aminotransferase class I/II-fold pyridoxal phosphate-dependent enzyme [Sandaracinaceae bacterium]
MSEQRPRDVRQFAGTTEASRAVHGGERRVRAGHPLAEPIVQSATYTFDDTADLVRYMEGHGGEGREEYGRYGNPTVRAFEEKLAALEGTADALAFASGMAAITTTILAMVKSGSHVVLFSDCYRRTRQFVTGFLDRFGVRATLVPPADLDALEAALTKDTRLVVSEAPTNPYQTVLDLERLAAICRPRRIKTMIDATFATPINLRPAAHGIDLVVHSATKYLGGHNDVLGGVVAGPEGPISLVRDLRHVLGGVLDPHAAYLLHRGVKTLAVRVAQQNRSALALAARLEAHPRVRRVWYPGLASHPSHAIASRLMSGFGGVVTFAVKGDLAAVSRVVDAMKIPRIAPSLGGVESLVEQPALMSYFELSSEERLALGMSDDLVRYAVGLEDTDELVADVLAALETP